MIKISKDDLDNYRNIGSGKYGTIYQVNKDIAYKIYHPKLVDYNGHTIKNPALKLPKKHFNMLKRKNDKLKFTDTLTDIILINGKFGGISIPYYDGELLKNLMKEEFSIKIDISKQLIRNAKELTDNHIYPLDYKLNNIMYVNGKVKIIDLDDNLTKVKNHNNPLYKKISIDGLNDTIFTLFNGYSYKPYSYNVRKHLDKKEWIKAKKYEDIALNLLEKEENVDYLIIDQFSNLDYVRRLANSNQYRILYKYDKKIYDDNYFLTIIDLLKSNNIRLYDFICGVDLPLLESDYNIKECFKVQEKRLIKSSLDKK